MRLAAPFVRLAVAAIAVLAPLSLAAAQPFTLTGRIIDQIPGGGTLVGAEAAILRVSPTGGSPVGVALLEPCEEDEQDTTNCIDASGVFTQTGLEPATYLLNVFVPGYIPKRLNVTVNSDTIVGEVGLIREPYKLEVTVADIPAAGGAIPVTVRGTKPWESPTLAVIVRVDTAHDTSSGFTEGLNVDTFEFTWPAQLTDTGVVPFGALDVSPADPAGTFHCANVEIRLQSNPRLIVARQNACNVKRP